MNAFEIHHDVAIHFFDWENLNAFGRVASCASFQTELVTVQRANHSTAAKQSFGKRALTMRTSIVSGKDSAVALSEYGERLTADHVAAPLSQWNGADTAQIDNGCDYFISHYFLQPPMRTLIRVH